MVALSCGVSGLVWIQGLGLLRYLQTLCFSLSAALPAFLGINVCVYLHARASAVGFIVVGALAYHNV